MPKQTKQGKKGKRKRAERKNIMARIHTARNKIKRINRALEFAGGIEIQRLKNRLEFWGKQL
jgi:hypothetical protein